MAYLHAKNIVHFDLKSANLLLGYRDRRAICKVADFGLSKQRDQPARHAALDCARDHQDARVGHGAGAWAAPPRPAPGRVAAFTSLFSLLRCGVAGVHLSGGVLIRWAGLQHMPCVACARVGCREI